MLHRPHNFNMGINVFRQSLRMTNMQMSTRVLMSNKLRHTMPIISSVIMRIQVNQQLITFPHPLFRIMVRKMHRVTQVRARLLRFNSRINAFFFNGQQDIHMKVPMSTRKSTGPLTFKGITLHFLINVITFTMTRTSSRTFRTINFHFNPISITLPSKGISRTFNLLRRRVILMIRRDFQVIMDTPIHTMFVTFRFKRLCIHINCDVFNVFHACQGRKFTINFNRQVQLLVFHTSRY